MRTACYILIVIFGLFLAAPAAQMAFRIAPESRLSGVVAQVPFPVFHGRDVWDGKWQSAISTWFDRQIGFRGAAVRSDNQAGYSVFREVWSASSDRPVLGRDNVLYQIGYVESYNGLNLHAESELESMAENLRKLQDALARRRIAMVLAISPSKAVLYPECLPASRVMPPANRPPSDYERMIPMLRARGVHTVDGPALFAAEKRRSSLKLFPPGGTHWNRYGAGLFIQQIWTNAERQLGRPLAGLRFVSLEETEEPSRRDKETDLVELMNLWRMGPSSWKQVRVQLEPAIPSGSMAPRVVMIGDSFAEMLVDIMRCGWVSSLDYYYYFSRRLRVPGSALTAVDRPKIDWEKDVFSAD
ncbi:MAG: hypothetical protein V2A34_14045, partial [Lentisphaerota bacterium]